MAGPIAQILSLRAFRVIKLCCVVGNHATKNGLTDASRTLAIGYSCMTVRLPYYVSFSLRYKFRILSRQ